MLIIITNYTLELSHLQEDQTLRPRAKEAKKGARNQRRKPIAPQLELCNGISIRVNGRQKPNMCGVGGTGRGRHGRVH